MPNPVPAEVPDPVPASEFYHAVRPVPDGPPDTFESGDRVVISPRFAAQWSLEEYENLAGIAGNVVISECGQTLVSFDPPNRYAKRPTLTFTNPYMLTKMPKETRPDEQPTGGKPARSPASGKGRKRRKERREPKIGQYRKAGMVPAEPKLIRRPKAETVETVETVGTAQVVLTLPTVRTAATVQTPEQTEGFRKVETFRVNQKGSRKVRRRRTSAERFR